jgi:hypothetical protein
MKNIIKVITVSSSLVIGMSVVGVASAADSTSGSASASIATALTLSTGADDLDFGTFAHSDTTAGGTVVVNTADGVGSASNVDADPTVTSGDFSVTGEPNATITITLPGDGVASLTHSGGAGSGQLPLSSFTDSGGGSLTLDGSGNGAFTVGATLAFDAIATDTAGDYTGTYDVTVAYQ